MKFKKRNLKHGSVWNLWWKKKGGLSIKVVEINELMDTTGMN